MNSRVVTPPATIGMLGGGQLGRYALIAARVMGYRTMVLEPDERAPAANVADEHLVAAYDDEAALDRMASTCAVITTEFENPPASSLERLARATDVAPSAAAVAIAQDRRAEKRFLAGAGIPIAPWSVVDSADAPAVVDYPAILKTARLGYDGKGQITVTSADQLPDAWIALGRGACVVEQAMSLDVELSVIVARTVDGRMATYDVAENLHVDGILDLTVVPARVASGVAGRATALARAIADALDYVGVLAVELFVVDGEVYVNELAPRPHNSGHWTLDAARASQFEQQIRAVCGVGLGDPAMTTPAVAMVNLLGDLWRHAEPDWTAALAEPRASLHLYGKLEARPGRKMGHLTITGGSADDVATEAIELRDAISRSR
ncbi:MAG TPA: 5-(carboxyamino)imidazole ribonucleotide synthase [Ilumatobacteraceae bacterium]|nr:5-(carboxyamino)imidazole ribonucleotide synthase [Ilumatobacteraceae bacterium]